jgi:diaminopimelate decarboxylase
MDHFLLKNNVLHAEDVSLVDIAEKFGTPTYVYSKATVTRHVQVLQKSLQGIDALICYAIKANGNLALLQLLQALHCHFDAVSIGELWRAQKAGIPAGNVILSGVGKRDAEIEEALKAGVLYICAESHEELAAIASIAANLGVVAPVAVRVNPDIDAKTHPYISTGLKENKFGVPIADASALYQHALTLKSIKMIGVTCHIGSQITDLRPFEEAAERMVQLVQTLKTLGVPLKHVGIGGGLGIPYRDETPPSPEQYGAALARIFGPLKLQVILEPGRVIIGNAGILLTRVIRQKQGTDRKFVIVDAGMNDLIRPALYKAYHTIVPVVASSKSVEPVDVVGPVCESADVFQKNYTLPPLQTGDLLALRSAGAYAFVMASNYNARLRPAEVMVDGINTFLVRKREVAEDLWNGEELL